MGAIIVAAYSYMALVPVVQPPVIKLLTTESERKIRMEYKQKSVSKLTKILFPIIITVITGIVSPKSVALVGFLMFGNLIRECGVLDSLSETAQKVLANVITLFLGITIATKMQADQFLTKETLMIIGLGLVAFIFDTAERLPHLVEIKAKAENHDKWVFSFYFFVRSLFKLTALQIR